MLLFTRPPREVVGQAAHAVSKLMPADALRQVGRLRQVRARQTLKRWARSHSVIVLSAFARERKSTILRLPDLRSLRGLAVRLTRKAGTNTALQTWSQVGGTICISS